ncbi:uncharacterized protein CcaverHIS019_0105220 [Cutaneotrichosporon cavernicola]|uniref:Uncharacterized protein n=1 Tax=Cutaneotrichosporon cavernicola TaxID=279322 RepID=A0AA48HYE4_9TREE|nr:uncharacterized protein CcaverHIS019_0105220 [Cutaneotrichosporon cavernicola]BEI87804.1 hypothetical protein CcaverHIS019_0105220 [Cutaneotrichosporon cavernicola]BEI95578.1 hypothetical protein CcaverHIS631_0105270 [Cutaneotrichosporon cavernicola]BEJ03352.1 hypothetical protein CcaverHIS641_0105270 [Cutaneotrichosporon cavernicola]
MAEPPVSARDAAALHGARVASSSAAGAPSASAIPKLEAGPSRVPPPPSGVKAAPILNGTAPRQAFPKRLLARYLRALEARPLRTKMITSMCLFATGDTLAQFGIEGRRLPWSKREEEGEKNDEVWDPTRAARLMFYGCFVFAPFAHNWINLLERVKFPSRLKTLAARVTLDQVVWGPFIVCLFWTSNGFLEGKTPAEVKAKLDMAFVPVYTKSLMVFGPTALVNFAFVPLQHRLLVGQSVGLGWNTYLSYLNHLNNKRLAAAAAALSTAELREAEEIAAHHDATAAHADVELQRAVMDKARARKEKLLQSQGGGATGVGTRMGV